MADCGFDGLTSMPGYDLKIDFGFNSCQRLRWLDFDASMADCGFDGLTSMPGYDLKIDFRFNGCQRLQCLDFDAWLRATKWLQHQWPQFQWQ